MLALLAACAAGRTPDAASPARGPAPPQTHSGLAAQRVDTSRSIGTPAIAAALVDTSQLETSIEAIWAPPHVPNVQVPLGPAMLEKPEHDLVAYPVARARNPGRRAPCFAKRDVLVGDEIWRDLEAYGISMSSEQPASARYGTCTIRDGELRDAHGTLLAEVHCGITVYVPGIIDSSGFEIGASGADIAAEHPRIDPLCVAEGDKHTRCWFTDEDSEAGMHYTVAARPSFEPTANGVGYYKGPAARAFFTQQRISHFTVRMTCH